MGHILNLNRPTKPNLVYRSVNSSENTENFPLLRTSMNAIVWFYHDLTKMLKLIQTKEYIII